MRAHFSRFVPALVFLAAFVAVQPARGQTEGADNVVSVTPAYMSDPKFQKALFEARDKKQPWEERLARWKNANKIAKNECLECLHEITGIQMSKSQWKDVVITTERIDQLSSEPKERFFTAAERGVALLHFNGDNPKADQLKQSEASLSAALALSPKTPQLLYMEGRALAMLGRDEEAKAQFTKYLEVVKMSDNYRTRAEHFIENPKLAAMHMAPPFTLTTSEGEQISLDDMGGKVVLLDFWATWCGPCKETLPEIKRVAKEFAGQPLVVISISGDANETEWRTFMDKNKMTWPQYRDANGALRQAYGVNAIPQFFTIDTDGALQSVKVGSGADISGDVRRLVSKAEKIEKKKAKESEHAAAGN